MKNKLGIFTAFLAAATAAFIGVSLLYKSFAFDGLGIPLNPAQTAALLILAAVFAVAAVVRFIAPPLFKEPSDEETEEKESCKPGIITLCLDWGAWLLLALSLSSLIASPLAGIADYISYAALFGVLSVLCALFPAVAAAEKAALHCDRFLSTAAFTTAALILSLVPAVGIYGGICGIVFYVTALREGKSHAKQCCIGLVTSMICTLIASAVTFLFVYLLF